MIEISHSDKKIIQNRTLHTSIFVIGLSTFIVLCLGLIFYAPSAFETTTLISNFILPAIPLVGFSLFFFKISQLNVRLSNFQNGNVQLSQAERKNWTGTPLLLMRILSVGTIGLSLIALPIMSFGLLHIQESTIGKLFTAQSIFYNATILVFAWIVYKQSTILQKITNKQKE